MAASPPMHQASTLRQSPAWQALEQEVVRFSAAHASSPPAFDLRTAFANNAQRQQRFSRTLEDADGELLHVDCSKSHIDDAVWQLLLQLAQERGVEHQRNAMFAGEAINTSEQRQVMHWLLRQPSVDNLPAELHSAWQEMDASRRAFLGYAETIRNNAAITDIVSIGIGGSELGPYMAMQALQPWFSGKQRFHFVSNIDGHALDQVLARIRPESTLFIISSKTFGTLETASNARSALQWFQQKTNGVLTLDQRFVAITANAEAAKNLGISNVFGLWDWVGGRYSLWSAIGLPLAIGIGATAFQQMLAGAHVVDRHFVETPAEGNLPLLLGLLQVWESSFLQYSSRNIAPYTANLRRLPAYLQQLEMESNGKSVTRSGEAVDYATAPSVWGEPGSNGQHSFFQLLRQGTQTIPVEFIAISKPQHALPEHHTLLLANALAQARALMLGNDDADPQKRIPGNRPSTFIVLPELTPRTLGALLALYEHRTFVCGAVWGINSFDQWGVEQGKALALDMAQRWHSGDTAGLDPSTASLLHKLRP